MELRFEPQGESSGGWLVQFTAEDFPEREALAGRLPWVSIPDSYVGSSQNPLLLDMFVDASQRGFRECLYMKSMFLTSFDTPKIPQIISFRFDIRAIGGQKLAVFDNAFVDTIEKSYGRYHSDMNDYDFVMFFLRLHSSLSLADYRASLSLDSHGGSIGLVKTILETAKSLPSFDTAMKYAKMLGVLDEFSKPSEKRNPVHYGELVTQLWDVVDVASDDLSSQMRTFFMELGAYRSLDAEVIIDIFNGKYTMEALKSLPSELLTKTLGV